MYDFEYIYIYIYTYTHIYTYVMCDTNSKVTGQGTLRAQWPIKSTDKFRLQQSHTETHTDTHT